MRRSSTAALELAQAPGERNTMRYEPLGVAAVIAPWNFPLAIPTGMSAAALAAGNAVVLKPAEQSPGCALALVEALHDAGVPAAALSLLPGEGDAGAALVRDPGVDLIAFTGSGAVGLEIVRAAAETPAGQDHVKRVIAEMGGKNCVIVDSDADLDDAVPAIVDSAFGYAGQKCSAASRVLVHEAVAESLLERLAGATDSLIVGQADDFAADVPPLIEAQARERVDGYREQVAATGRIATAPAALPDGGWFSAPTVATALPADSPALHEEIFGPLVCVEPVAGIEEALGSGRLAAVRAHRGAVLPRPEDDRRRWRRGSGRQPLRQPLDHRGDGRPPAVRRQPAVGDRRAGGRARLPAPVHASTRGQREHDAPRARDHARGAGRRLNEQRAGSEPARCHRRSPGRGPLPSTARLGRSLRKLDGDGPLVAAAKQGELERVARLLRIDRGDHVVHAGDRRAVDGGDHVAAGADPLAGDRDLGVARLDPGLGRGAVGDDGLDQGAAVLVEVEHIGDLRRQVGAADADERVLDLARGDQLLGDLLGGVDRDREADADVAARLTGLDLRVDPDHLALGVDQRTARVAGVDRRVGLDRVLDREPVRGVDLALDRGDDPRGGRAVEPERVADRDHGIADLDPGRGAELERLQLLGAGIDLEHGDVGRGIGADDLGVEGLAVLAADPDGDLIGALDDVGVGEDVAVGIDHEAGPGRGAALRGAEGIERRGLGLLLGLDVDDAGRVLGVDLVDAERLAGIVGGESGGRGGVGDGGRGRGRVAAGVHESGRECDQAEHGDDQTPRERGGKWRLDQVLHGRGACPGLPKAP